MLDLAAELALREAVSEVLETMFFTSVFSAAEGREAAGGIGVRLPFRGARPGEFRLAISPEAARSIAAGFLGAEDESQISEAQIGDVVCEVANMVCGSLLSRLEPDLAFNLHPPWLAEPDPGDNLWTFDLGNGVLSAGIRFDPS